MPLTHALLWCLLTRSNAVNCIHCVSSVHTRMGLSCAFWPCVGSSKRRPLFRTPLLPTGALLNGLTAVVDTPLRDFLSLVVRDAPHPRPVSREQTRVLMAATRRCDAWRGRESVPRTRAAPRPSGMIYHNLSPRQPQCYIPGRTRRTSTGQNAWLWPSARTAQSSTKPTWDDFTVGQRQLYM